MFFIQAGTDTTTIRHVNTLPRNAPDKTPLKLYFPPVIRSVTKSNRLSIMKFSRKKRSMYNSSCIFHLPFHFESSSMSYRIIKFALWKFCQMLTVKQKENRRISDILRHKKKNGLILQTVSSFFNSIIS